MITPLKRASERRQREPLLSSVVDSSSAALISVLPCVFLSYCASLKAAGGVFVPAIARAPSFMSRSVFPAVCARSSVIVCYLFHLCVTRVFNLATQHKFLIMPRFYRTLYNEARTTIFTRDAS